MTAHQHKNYNLLSTAKWAFTTRRVQKKDIKGFSIQFENAVAGDLVIAQVTRIGSHAKTQLASGRPSELSVGDTIVLCCGDRYAPDQFEGRAQISGDGSDMLAGGGIIGKMIQSHASMASPTQLKPIALLTDASGDVINIASYTVPQSTRPSDMMVIGVVGASMNAGKTTATAALGHGLTKAGYKVAGIKATGTGAFGDFNTMLDAGLHCVSDFTDAGMASTYMQSIDTIERGFISLLADAKNKGAEIAMVELADGIYQKETSEMLRMSDIFRETVDGLMFASGDAVSVVGGVTYLTSIGYQPLAVSGKVSLSPLASQEAERLIQPKIYSKADLKSAEVARQIISPVLNRRYGRLTQAA